MNFIRYLILAILYINHVLCMSQEIKKRNAYEFFVAGHTYGNPGIERDPSKNSLGLHTPFKNKFELIANNDKIKFGVLTGDVVWQNNKKEWDAVDQDISKINKKVYFAVGNHDIANRELFEARYGSTYYFFTFEKDLFIFLDPNYDGWNISDKQLAFLKKTLKENSSKVANIFVFFHQLLWWTPNNKYSKIKPNSTSGRSENTNFWSEIEPLFKTLSNNVIMFAGDIGAFSNRTSVVYHTYDNITLIASGMGGGVNDNFIIVKVDHLKNIEFKLIALNHLKINGMGRLKNHELLLNKRN